jgi:hypothetical protein
MNTWLSRVVDSELRGGGGQLASWRASRDGGNTCRFVPGRLGSVFSRYAQNHTGPTRMQPRERQSDGRWAWRR